MNTVKLLRNTTPCPDLKAAIFELNSYEHQAGQPVMMYYYSTMTKSERIEKVLDCVVAIGLIDGTGRDAYSIISSSNSIIVSSVSTSLPDVSQSFLPHVFFNTETKTSYWVYLEDSSRIIDQITSDANILVKDVEGKSWWVTKNSIKLADAYTDISEFNEVSNLVNSIASIAFENKSEIDQLKAALNALLTEGMTASINKITPEADVLRLGTPVIMEAEVRVSKDGVNITNDCDFFVYRTINNPGVKEEAYYDSVNKRISVPFYQTEELIVVAKHSGTGAEVEFADRIRLDFVYPSVYGVLSDSSVDDGKWHNWDQTDVVNLYDSDYNSTKFYDLIAPGKELSFTTVLGIDQYLYIAVPFKENVCMLDIAFIGDFSGQDLTEDFAVYSGVSITPPRVGDYEYSERIQYKIYVKKTPINSNGKLIKFTALCQ